MIARSYDRIILSFLDEQHLNWLIMVLLAAWPRNKPPNVISQPQLNSTLQT